MTIIDIVQEALSEGETGLRGFFVEKLMLLIHDRQKQHPEQEAEVAYWRSFKSILDDFQIACHAWAQERAMSKEEQSEFTLKVMRDSWRFDHLPKWMIVSVRNGLFIESITDKIATYPTVNEHQIGGEQLFSSFCAAVQEAIQSFLPLDDEHESDNIAKHGFPSYWKSLSPTQRAAIAGHLHGTLEAKFLQLLQNRYLSDATLPSEHFQPLLSRARSFLLIFFTRCDGSKLQSWVNDADTSHLIVAEYLRSANPRHWETDNRLELRQYYGQKYGGIVGGRAVLYNNATVIKSVRGSLLHEVLAMELVKARTRIPVPRVLMTFSLNGEMFMVMSEIKGNQLRVSSRTTDNIDYSNISTQLQSFIEELQALGSDLQGPVHGIGAWPYGPLNNVVFDPPLCQPLCSLKEFHIYWRKRSRENADGATNFIGAHAIVLSHGDLNPSNIIVDDGVIVGIVDWDTFGWYPDFWEPMMATRLFLTPKLKEDFKEKLVNACGKREISTIYHKILQLVFVR